MAQGSVDLKPTPLGRDERHADCGEVEGAAEAVALTRTARRLARGGRGSAAVALAEELRADDEPYEARDRADGD